MPKDTKPCSICSEPMPKGMNNVCGYKCQNIKASQKPPKAPRAPRKPKVVLKSTVTNRAYPKRSKMIKALVDDAKKKIKERDNYTCQKCYKQLEGKSCQGSHVIPMGRCGNNALAWDENNIKVLCGYCHLRWWHAHPMEASEWFKERFPERWEYIQNFETKKLSSADIQELYDQLKSRP